VTFAGLYPEVPIRNIILLTAPLDFSSQPEGSMAVWLDEDRLDVDKLVDALDNVPGELIRHWAKMLKPMENFIGVYVNLWKLLDDEMAVWGWQAINRWVEDVVPVAGAAFRQFVKEYVRENKLVNDEHVIDGRPVLMANIDASLLNIVAQYDHLVDQSQAESIMDLVSSEDKELKVLPSTHVGIMISGRARYKLWPEVAGWLGERSN
jgi:polyhydroxyalkanoate synthase